MARITGIEFMPVPGHNNLPNMSRVDGLIIHTIVGYAPAEAAHFSTWSNGHTRQHRDTGKQSAANYQGNPYYLAVENEDHGPAYGPWNRNNGHEVPAFTGNQCEALAVLCVKLHHQHGIPLVPLPSARPGSRGIGWHRQGIDSPNNFAGYEYGGRVSGGLKFSTSAGKVCPGDRRIRQILHTIIPRARVLAGLDAPPPAPPAPPEEELDVRNLILVKGETDPTTFLVNTATGTRRPIQHLETLDAIRAELRAAEETGNVLVVKDEDLDVFGSVTSG